MSLRMRGCTAHMFFLALAAALVAGCAGYTAQNPAEIDESVAILRTYEVGATEEEAILRDWPGEHSPMLEYRQIVMGVRWGIVEVSKTPSGDTVYTIGYYRKTLSNMLQEERAWRLTFRDGVLIASTPL